MIFWYFVYWWCWYASIYALPHGSSELTKRAASINAVAGPQRANWPKPLSTPPRARAVVQSWPQYRYRDPNFNTRFIRNSNRYLLRLADGQCIYEEFPKGRPPNLEFYGLPPKTPLFVPRLLQPADVLRVLNKMHWTQHYEDLGGGSYQKLVELLNQKEPDEALENLFNDVDMNTLGCDERICQLKEIGLSTKFEQFDWGTVSQAEALALAIYFVEIEDLYIDALNGLTITLGQKHFPTFLMQQLAKELLENFRDARDAIRSALWKARVDRHEFGKGQPGPDSWA